MDLQLEVNESFTRANDTIFIKDQQGNTQVGGLSLIITPPLDEDYWLFRVKLHADQAIVGFPKFATIGVGFAQENDWNTNLPYTCPAGQIFDHIKHNKQYDEIADDQCLEAIKMVQVAAKGLEKESAAD